MRRFDEAVEGFGWETDEFGAVYQTDRYTRHGEEMWTEVRLEPLLFGQYYVAIYTCTAGGGCALLAEKVPVRAGGGRPDGNGNAG